MTERQKQNAQPLVPTDDPAMQERRAFLRSLGKWSQAVIGGVLLGGGLTASHQANAGAWINRRGYGGGGWINGGGGGWINRRGGYGGSWINR
jgi:hypothetical protein